MIKAIETVYNGYKFRSRLEARWAVFFDALGIRYQYEPEGFNMDDLWYLPDFYLLDYKMWIEVKPTTPELDTLDKCRKLSDGLNNDALILYGTPWPGEYSGTLFKAESAIDKCTSCGYLVGKSDYSPSDDMQWLGEMVNLAESTEGKIQDRAISEARKLLDYMCKKLNQEFQDRLRCPSCLDWFYRVDYPYCYEVWEYRDVVFYEPNPDAPENFLILWSRQKRNEYNAIKIDGAIQETIQRFGGVVSVLESNGIMDLPLAFLSARQARFEHGYNGNGKNGHAK